MPRRCSRRTLSFPNWTLKTRWITSSARIRRWRQTITRRTWQMTRLTSWSQITTTWISSNWVHPMHPLTVAPVVKLVAAPVARRVIKTSTKWLTNSKMRANEWKLSLLIRRISSRRNWRAHRMQVVLPPCALISRPRVATEKSWELRVPHQTIIH